MTVLDAVESVLATTGTPLSYREIADRILKTGLWQTRGKTPQATVNAQLAIDTKKHGPRSRFQRTGSGAWGLRTWSLPECHPGIPSDEPSHAVTNKPSAPSLKPTSSPGHKS